MCKYTYKYIYTYICICINEYYYSFSSSLDSESESPKDIFICLDRFWGCSITGGSTGSICVGTCALIVTSGMITGSK
jgi:hypothetical protein